MKVDELRVLEEDQLGDRLKAARRELYELRFKHAVGQLEAVCAALKVKEVRVWSRKEETSRKYIDTLAKRPGRERTRSHIAADVSRPQTRLVDIRKDLSPRRAGGGTPEWRVWQRVLAVANVSIRGTALGRHACGCLCARRRPARRVW